MENEPPLTSPDGSSKRNPPERCPHPLYSRDPTQEDLTVPHHDQGGEPKDIKPELKEEEDDTLVSVDQQSFEEESPLYSRDSIQEDLTVLHHDQGEEPKDIKPEIKEEEDDRLGEEIEAIKAELKEEEEETLVSGAQQSMEDGEPNPTWSLHIEPDGSSKRNPPERCPRPLYSRDPTQEDLTILQHSQSGILGDNNIVVKEEYKQEDKEYGVMEDFSEEHKDLSKDVMMEPFSSRDPPESSPRPLYSRDSTQEDLTVPHHDQGEEPKDIKPEVKEGEDNTLGEELKYLKAVFKEEEETLVSGAQQSMEEGEMNPTWSLHIDTDGDFVWNRYYTCSECGKSFVDRGDLVSHERIHNGGKDFAVKGNLIQHKSEADKHRFSCSMCGKIFNEKEKVLTHQRSHTGERPFLCSECGKYFVSKAKLLLHQKRHTGECPYPCSECRKCFAQKGDLVKHQRIHTGERPYTCSECGKSFTEKRSLSNHQKLHTGERPYSCSECGKRYIDKQRLSKHQAMHTRDRAFSC